MLKTAYVLELMPFIYVIWKILLICNLITHCFCCLKSPSNMRFISQFLLFIPKEWHIHLLQIIVKSHTLVTKY